MRKNAEIIKELSKADVEKLKVDCTKIEDINVYRAIITNLVVK